MFNMKKNLLQKTNYVLFALFILFISCENDETIINNNQDSKKFKIEKLNYKQIKKNNKLINKLNAVTNTSGEHNRIISTIDNSFYIDTDLVTYIEDLKGNHSYIFAIVRDSTQYLLENLVISQNTNNDYSAHLIQYDITESELNQMYNGNLNIITLDKLNIKPFDLNSLNDDIFAKADKVCSCGFNNYLGDDGNYYVIDEVNQDGTVTWIQHSCGGSGGGGGGQSNGGAGSPSSNTTGGVFFPTGYTGDGNQNTNQNTNPNTSGGNHTPPKNTIITTPVYKEFISREQILREKCFMSSTNSNGLTFNQRIFLNSNSNQTIKAEILKYLESQVTDQTATCPNQDAFNYVKQIINDLMNNECVILPKFLDPTQVTAPYDPNIFGDYPAPTVQQDHDAIQQQFNNLRNTSGNLAAVNYLISTYNMNTFGPNTINMNYSISFADGLLTGDHANAIIGYNPSGTMVTCELQIDTNLFSFQDFGYITRVIKHELYHVFQAENYGQFNVSNAAREFDAYYSQLFGFRNLKKINDIGIEEGIAKKICEYLDQMTESEKNESEQKINTFNFYFLRICNN